MAALDRSARRLPERRTGAESLEFDDCSLQALLQCRGLQASVLALEALASGEGHAAALAQPLVWRAGHVVALAQLGPDAVFTHELHYRLPVIRPQPKDLVHVVELLQSGLALVAVVADHLSGDRPIFLLALCELRDYGHPSQGAVRPAGGAGRSSRHH